MRKSLLILILIFMSCSKLAEGAQDVIVVKSYSIKPYEEAIRGFKSVCNCSIKEFDLSETDGQDVLREIRKRKPAIVLTIGADALELAKEIETPIVYTMVLNPQSIVSKKENISGVSMEIPPGKQVDEFHKALPGIKRIGLVYDPRKTPAGFVSAAIKAAESKGITLVAREVSSSMKVMSAVNSMKESIDAFWMLPDSTVVTPETVEFLLMFSVENTIPILAFSEKYVEVGAIMSLSMDAFAMGRNAGEIAQGIIGGEDAGNMPISSNGRIVLSINLRAAGKLGILINSDSINRARIISK